MKLLLITIALVILMVLPAIAQTDKEKFLEKYKSKNLMETASGIAGCSGVYEGFSEYWSKKNLPAVAQSVEALASESYVAALLLFYWVSDPVYKIGDNSTLVNTRKEGEKRRILALIELEDLPSSKKLLNRCQKLDDLTSELSSIASIMINREKNK